MPSPGEELAALVAGVSVGGRQFAGDAILAVEHGGLGCFAGRDAAGFACVLVPTTGTGPGRHLRLRNVEAREGVRCEVASPDGAMRLLCGTLVICRSDRAGMVRMFLGMVADALGSLGPMPAAADVSRWVVRAAELFSRLEGAGRRTMQGLWAELIVASALPNPELAVRRWHPDPSERYDFTSGPFSIEVKSCGDLDRVHHFSLDQLSPRTGVDVWIASVVARPEPLGVSVLDVAADLEARIASAEVRAKLREVVFSSAGEAIADDDLYRFDAKSAQDSLRLLDRAAIPSIPGPLPPELLAVQFRVRCAAVPEVGGLQEASARLD